MHFDDFNYDAVEAAPNEHSLLEPGEYLATITGLFEKNTAKDGTPYLQYEYTISAGDSAGRKLWDNVFYAHPAGSAAKDIAHRRIKMMIDACGIQRQPDAEDFLQHSVLIRVGIEKDKTGQYSDKNNIKAVLAPKETARPSPAPEPSSPQTKPNAPAWAKG